LSSWRDPTASSGESNAMRIPPALKSTGLLQTALLAVLLLIAYGAAAIMGTAEAGLTGFARLHSAARDTYCQGGLTPFAAILMAQMGLLLLALVGNHLWPDDGRYSDGGRRPWRDIFRGDGWYVLVLLTLVAVPYIIAWQTDSSVCVRGRAFFWQSIYIELFILSILAMSYNLMFGFTGVVSFGHAAFFGMGAYTVGLLMRHAEWSWWAAVIGALLVGAFIGLIKGVVGLRIRGLYFALFTLAFAEILHLLAGNRILVNYTGAEDGFTFAVPDFLNMTTNRLFFYYLALVCMVFSFLLVRRLMNSPTGRVLNALRDNEDRAQMLGYNVFYFKLIAIIISGVMATGAGALRGFALKGASPNVLGLDFTINPLLMMLIGGQGTFLGPVLGAFGLRLTEQMLRDTILTVGGLQFNIGERWALILGVIFILSVMVFPQGIVGTWQANRLSTLDGWLRLLRWRRD
jgi:branched-chain amino acid transport system permease protein